MKHTLNASDVELIIQALTEKAALDKALAADISSRTAAQFRAQALRCETLSLLFQCAGGIMLHDVELGKGETCAAS